MIIVSVRACVRACVPAWPACLARLPLRSVYACAYRFGRGSLNSLTRPQHALATRAPGALRAHAHAPTHFPHARVRPPVDLRLPVCTHERLNAYTCAHARAHARVHGHCIRRVGDWLSRYRPRSCQSLSSATWTRTPSAIVCWPSRVRDAKTCLRGEGHRGRPELIWRRMPGA